MNASPLESGRVPFQFPQGHENLLRGLPKKQLTTEQEDTFAKRIKASGRKDDESINALVLHSMREAFFYGLACARGKLPPDEVFSACYAGLRCSATRFAPGRIRFFAYAKPDVRGEICKAFNALKVVRNAVTQTLVPDLISNVDDFGDSTGINPGIPFRSEELRDAKVDVVEPDTEGVMVREEWKILLPVLREKLSEKERMVLELKYQSGFNFRQIGDLLRVSRSDTQATHTRAINKVRSALKGKRALLGR